MPEAKYRHVDDLDRHEVRAQQLCLRNGGGRNDPDPDDPCPGSIGFGT